MSEAATGLEFTGDSSELSSTDRELVRLVDRLRRVVQAETTDLEQHVRYDVSVVTRKKSHMLLELSRLSRTRRDAPKDPILRDKLSTLKDALDTNEKALEMHLRAARQLTELITNVVRNAESDGTYSGASDLGAPSQ